MNFNMLSARNTAVTSLHESGTARLCFTDDLNSFDGVLINAQEEVYALAGRSVQSICIFDVDELSDSANSVQYEVSVIDGETATEYLIRKVKLTVEPNTGFCVLNSDALRFETSDLLIGNRADVEIRAFMNPNQADNHRRLHLGAMSINFQTAITPPPTPSSSNNDASESPMDEDFFK